MLPEGVLSIAIRADFWQPQINERKAELIKYWHQCAVLDSVNIGPYRYQKSCIQPCHGHFTAMPNKPQNVSYFCFFFLLLFVTLFISRRFLRTIADRDIINTPLEPLRPADVPFGGFVDIAPHFWGEIPQKNRFWGVDRRFHAKRAKY